MRAFLIILTVLASESCPDADNTDVGSNTIVIWLAILMALSFPGSRS